MVGDLIRGLARHKLAGGGFLFWAVYRDPRWSGVMSPGATLFALGLASIVAYLDRPLVSRARPSPSDSS